MKEKIKKVSLIVSIIIVVGASFVFAKPIYALALGVLYHPRWDTTLMLLSAIFLMGSMIYILYTYLLCIIEAFQNKKKCKPILMLLVIALVIAIAIILELEARTFLGTVFIPFLYIVCVIVIPIIVLGIILLKESNHKIRKIILAIVWIAVTIGVYIVHYSYLTTATNAVISNVQVFFVSDEDTATNLAEYNLIYLENYKQKMETEGYLDKFDVENILKIVDSRVDHIIVHYNDGQEEFEYNNVDNQLTEELGSKLEGDFYKFQYTHKNEQTDIYIEKYESETTESNEKNADIFLTTEPNYNVTNITADYETEDDENYLIENRVNLEKGTETTIDSLEIVFAYDSERHNYIPYVDDEQLSMIESYEIYSTGMSITLKEGVTLTKKDYTLRINRYNENLVVDEDEEPFYYYKYEPIAEEMKDSNGNTVIEFSFDNTYPLGDLKNIEIIF